MLELHFIRTMLDILDFTIVFQGEKEEDLYTKEETCHVFHATLSYTPDCCLNVGWKTINPLLNGGLKPSILS